MQIFQVSFVFLKVFLEISQNVYIDSKKKIEITNNFKTNTLQIDYTMCSIALRKLSSDVLIMSVLKLLVCYFNYFIIFSTHTSDTHNNIELINYKFIFMIRVVCCLFIYLFGISFLFSFFVNVEVCSL